MVQPSSPKRPAKELPGWFRLWSALSIAGTLFFLIFAMSIGFDFWNGEIVAPTSEIAAAFVLGFFVLAPTIWWCGHLALRLLRRS